MSERPVFSRRAFLQAFLPAAIIAPVLAEELIWQPTKTIVLPPAGGWWVPAAGNTLLTISYITNEALKILEADIRIAEGIRYGNQFNGRRYGHIVVNDNTYRHLRSITDAWQA
jgi:hypothetical protein